MDNPIQKLINEGMSPLAAYFTNATCGEACWHAREDICRCSCGGRNHGCMRTENGIKPNRTAKIDGHMYELQGIGEGTFELAQTINRNEGIEFLYACTSRDYCYRSIKAKIRTATDAQMHKWKELEAYRGKIWTEENGKVHYIDKPFLLWIKVG